MDLRGMIRMIMLGGSGHCPGRSGHRLQRWKGWVHAKRRHGWRSIFGRRAEKSGDGGMRPSVTMAEEAGIPRQCLVAWISFKVLY